MKEFLLVKAALVVLVTGSEAFVPTTGRTTSRTEVSSVELSMLWRHWIPEESKADFVRDDDDRVNDKTRKLQRQKLQNERVEADAKNLFLGSLLALAIVVAPATSVLAVSGGGLDYAGLDISGQDYSNSNSYKGKDFTQVIAKGANFAKSNLQGCRFYKVRQRKDKDGLFDWLEVFTDPSKRVIL
jgi:uncharacterized protein YjbI with pentapeptide repeats